MNRVSKPALGNGTQYVCGVIDPLEESLKLGCQATGELGNQNLNQKLLRPDQPIPDHYSVRALNNARRAIAATHVADFSGQLAET
jgi:hypothetical protein